MNVFITGTDTDVGKTFFTCLWIRHLRTQGIHAVGMKPITCGSLEDVEQLLTASEGTVTAADIHTLALTSPLSPFMACQIEQQVFDPLHIRRAYYRLCHQAELVLVEGVGGWLTPLTANYRIADLAQALQLPIILVVDNKLGALNHTLLTLESIAHYGLPCHGIVLNQRPSSTAPDLATQTNRAALEALTEVPILYELQPDQERLEDACK